MQERKIRGTRTIERGAPHHAGGNCDHPVQQRKMLWFFIELYIGSRCVRCGVCVDSAKTTRARSRRARARSSIVCPPSRIPCKVGSSLLAPHAPRTPHASRTARGEWRQCFWLSRRFWPLCAPSTLLTSRWLPKLIITLLNVLSRRPFALCNERWQRRLGADR